MILRWKSHWKSSAPMCFKDAISSVLSSAGYCFLRLLRPPLGLFRTGGLFPCPVSRMCALAGPVSGTADFKPPDSIKGVRRGRGLCPGGGLSLGTYWRRSTNQKIGDDVITG